MTLKKRAIIMFTAITTVAAALAVYSFLVLREFKQGLDVPILAYVTDNSYPYIPKFLARGYFEYFDFDANADTRIGMPAYNFLLAGYGLHGEANNRRILELSDVFLRNCADIDRVYEGFSPLNAAVLSNEAELVHHLVLNGADLHSKVENPGSRIDGLIATELAVALAEHKPRDNAKVLAALIEQPALSVKRSDCAQQNQ
jgi:hypothetical protein